VRDVARPRSHTVRPRRVVFVARLRRVGRAGM